MLTVQSFDSTESINLLIQPESHKGKNPFIKEIKESYHFEDTRGKKFHNTHSLLQNRSERFLRNENPTFDEFYKNQAKKKDKQFSQTKFERKLSLLLNKVNEKKPQPQPMVRIRKDGDDIKEPIFNAKQAA